MAKYLSPLKTPAEFQWDGDSAPEQPVNCGPSSAEKVANYYNDRLGYGIEKTRKLGTTRKNTGTNTTEQSKMLSARGIPSSALQLKVDKIHETLKSSHRPIILWLRMSEIPANIRQHPFLGAHAVAGLANGNGGIWYMDPNFHRDRAVHPDKIFLPDKYLEKASAAIGRWCIVPDAPKKIDTRNPLKRRFMVKTAAVHVRSGPSAGTAVVMPNLHKGDVFKSNKKETAGGSYKGPGGKTRRDWIGFVRNGRQVWVAKAYVRRVK